MSNTYGSHQEYFASMMKKAAPDSMKDWIEFQKEMLGDYRDLIEERSKSDNEFLTKWTKSCMASSFKMLELHRKSMDMAQQAHLDHIDKYLEYLDSVPANPDDSKDD